MNMNPSTRLPLATGLYAALLLAACNPQPDDSGQRESRAGQGREETQGIRNTENIGYSGNAVADRLDAALDANDRRTEDLDRQLQQIEGN